MASSEKTQQQRRKALKLYTGPKARNVDALDFASAKVIAIYRRNTAKDLAVSR